MPDCTTCKHPEHVGRCEYPITEDIRAGKGIYDPVGVLWRTDIVDICHCQHNCGQ